MLEAFHSSKTITPLLVRACRREILERPPVWLMRQAGRYMPEYRAVREKVGFLELCKSPERAVEVSLQPLHVLGVDAVIMFSDILIPVEAMGMPLEFTEQGPLLSETISCSDDVNRLSIPDPVEKTGFVMEILKHLRQELSSDPDVALIGFAGAPWTLASYMVEGGTSRNHTRIKSLMYNEPLLLHALLDKIAQTIVLYLNAQIEAGAHVVQLFDTWGGILPEAQYREFVHPYQQRVFAGLTKGQAATILYVKGSSHVLELLPETGADVISLDELTPISQARSRLGRKVALQGNLDNNALFAKPDLLVPMIQALIREGGSQGYIFNLGHGLLPATPVENVQLTVDTVKKFSFALSGSASGL